MKIERNNSHCISLTADKMIKLIDKKHAKSKSVYKLENKNNENVNIIDIDNCLMKDSELNSCDWGIETKEIVFFYRIKRK